MGVKPLTEHHLDFLSLKGGCTGSSESTLVKIPHCLKSRVAAQRCHISDGLIMKQKYLHVYGIYILSLMII